MSYCIPLALPTSLAKASLNSGIPGAGQYPVLPPSIATLAALMTLLGVDKLMSPKWNGNIFLPVAAKLAASAETAKAVSLPKRSILFAIFIKLSIKVGVLLFA